MYLYLLEKVNMDIDSLCMQIYAGPEKKRRFLPEKVLKIVDCRECGGLLAKPTCTATVYFHNFTIPEY